jgi:hypothetical protein
VSPSPSRGSSSTAVRTLQHVSAKPQYNQPIFPNRAVLPPVVPDLTFNLVLAHIVRKVFCQQLPQRHTVHSSRVQTALKPAVRQPPPHHMMPQFSAARCLSSNTAGSGTEPAELLQHPVDGPRGSNSCSRCTAAGVGAVHCTPLPVSQIVLLWDPHIGLQEIVGTICSRTRNISRQLPPA